jgi:hypothetical protein
MKTKTFAIDREGNRIEKYNEVYVPEPESGDLHNFEFTGMVDGFRHGNVIVSDQDGNAFEFKPQRLIKA